MRAAEAEIEFRSFAVESSPLGAARASKPRRRRVVVIVACALLLAACSSLGSASYLYAKAAAGQWLLHRAWARSIETHTSQRPWPWADTHPVARLIAARQDVDLLVLAGASGRTLAWGPGHLDGTALPGTAGNSIVSGHRDTHFRFLSELAVGDALIVELPDGARRHYRVTRTFATDVQDLALSRDALAPTLTLVTCYPFDALAPGGSQRYVVVAEAS
jgi:sortase A